MPRTPLPVGTWGELSTRKLGSGKWQARAYFRDHDGETRQVSATGKTGAKAKDALREKLAARAVPLGGDFLNSESTVSVLADAWLADVEADGEVKENTLVDYRRNVRLHVKPALGGLRLREITTSRVDRVVKCIRDDQGKRSTARQVRVNLGQMFDHAIRHDAMKVNPVRSVKRVKVKKKEVRALTVDDLPLVAELIVAYMTADRPGPKVNGDLLDVMTLQLATGCRIGEVLGMRWRDLDVDDQGRTWFTVRGQVIKPKSDKKGTGRKAGPVYWQPEAKTEAGYRRLLLPEFAAEVLADRYDLTGDHPLGAVFVSRVGTWKDPHNVRRQWRSARADSGYEWVVPHTMRKTAGTAVHRALGPEATKDQLGHASTEVAEIHYVEKLHQGPEGTAEVMRPFGEAFRRGRDAGAA